MLKQRSLKLGEEIKNFESKYSIFFREFQADKMNLFYVLYILRRIVLVIAFHFTIDKGFQFAVSISSSLIVKYIQIFFYIAFSRIFKSRSQNFYHFINESMIASFYSIILVNTLNNNSKMGEEIAIKCVYLIMIAWAFNITFSSVTNSIKIFKKIKYCLDKRRLRKIQQEFPTQIFAENEENTKKIKIDK